MAEAKKRTRKSATPSRKRQVIQKVQGIVTLPAEQTIATEVPAEPKVMPKVSNVATLEIPIVTQEVKAEPVLEVAEVLPPQPLPHKGKYVPAIVLKSIGIDYDSKILADKLPPDARLWRYKNELVYSLVERTNSNGIFYEMFEPTGDSEQLPEKLFRAIKAEAIRKVFTYHNKGLEKLNLGLGITFVIVCIVTLFILGNVMMGG